MTRIMILLLSFQLIMVNAPLLAATIDEQREACTGKDRSWDSTLNRCMVTQEAIEMRDETHNCESSNDPETCYMNQAQQRTGVKEGDEYNDSNVEMVGKVVAGAYSMFSLITALTAGGKASGIDEAKSTGCISKKIFQGTSIAWIAGDLFLKHQAKKNFKEMAEDFKTEQKNTELKGSADSSYQSQVRAFHYLRQEQEQIKQQGKNRSKLQMAVTLGYAASLGFSIYELTPAGLPKRCVTTTKGDTVGEDGKRIDPDKSFAKQVRRLGTSAQIALASGVMLGLNAYLIYHALNEVKKAEKNIETIDDVIATYDEFMSGFCPDGREDINNDRCYCYNEDGSKNENRTKSVICQNLFAADDMNFALQNKTLKPLAEGPRQGCVTVTGQFDLDCKCAKMKNNVTGQNACSQAPTSSLLTGGFGTKLGAANAVNTMGSFPNGANKALGSLNGAELAKQAAKSDRLIENLIKDVNAKGIRVKGPDQLQDFAKKLALQNSSPKEIADFNKAFTPRGKQFGATPQGLGLALKKAQEKVDVTSSTGLSARSGTGKIGAGKKSGQYKFNWNDTAAREGNKVQTFMQKKYDYKGSDIVKRDDVSLWNVISNRYQTSGLRRLFGDDE